MTNNNLFTGGQRVPLTICTIKHSTHFDNSAVSIARRYTTRNLSTVRSLNRSAMLEVATVSSTINISLNGCPRGSHINLPCIGSSQRTKIKPTTVFFTRNSEPGIDSVREITACAAATSRCISDVPFQWERRNFDPPQLPHFSPIFLKLKTKRRIRDTNPHAKFGKDRFTGGVWANTHIFGRTFWATLFTPRDAMLARVFATATCLSVRLSVRMSVCHTPVLCLAERKQDREMYTI